MLSSHKGRRIFSKAINVISNKKQQVSYLLGVDGSSYSSKVHMEEEHLWQVTDSSSTWNTEQLYLMLKSDQCVLA